MNEIWRDIPNFEGLYQVSNLGRVKALEKYVNAGIKNNSEVKRKGRILKQYNKGGYLEVSLMKNNKRHYFKVHRLVATAFIPNFCNLPQVNHIDENKLNNNVDNLEWCTSKYNCNYGKRNNLIAQNSSFKPIKINQYDLDNNLLNTFDSISSASRYYGCKPITIRRYCSNITKCKDYIWRYADK